MISALQALLQSGDAQSCTSDLRQVGGSLGPLVVGVIEDPTRKDGLSEIGWVVRDRLPSLLWHLEVGERLARF